MTSSEQLAQALIQFLAFYTPAFIVFLVIDWATSLFRKDD